MKEKAALFQPLHEAAQVHKRVRQSSSRCSEGARGEGGWHGLWQAAAYLPCSCSLYGLSLLNLATKTVDLTSAKACFLAAQQQTAIPLHKCKLGAGQGGICRRLKPLERDHIR